MAQVTGGRIVGRTKQGLIVREFTASYLPGFEPTGKSIFARRAGRGFTKETIQLSQAEQQEEQARQEFQQSQQKFAEAQGKKIAQEQEVSGLSASATGVLLYTASTLDQRLKIIRERGGKLSQLENRTIKKLEEQARDARNEVMQRIPEIQNIERQKQSLQTEGEALTKLANAGLLSGQQGRLTKYNQAVQDLNSKIESYQRNIESTNQKIQSFDKTVATEAKKTGFKELITGEKQGKISPFAITSPIGNVPSIRTTKEEKLSMDIDVKATRPQVARRISLVQAPGEVARGTANAFMGLGSAGLGNILNFTKTAEIGIQKTGRGLGAAGIAAGKTINQSPVLRETFFLGLRLRSEKSPEAQFLISGAKSLRGESTEPEFEERIKRASTVVFETGTLFTPGGVGAARQIQSAVAAEDYPRVAFSAAGGLIIGGISKGAEISSRFVPLAAKTLQQKELLGTGLKAVSFGATGGFFFVSGKEAVTQTKINIAEPSLATFERRQRQTSAELAADLIGFRAGQQAAARVLRPLEFKAQIGEAIFGYTSEEKTFVKTLAESTKTLAKEQGKTPFVKEPRFELLKPKQQVEAKILEETIRKEGATLFGSASQLTQEVTPGKLPGDFDVFASNPIAVAKAYVARLEAKGIKDVTLSTKIEQAGEAAAKVFIKGEKFAEFHDLSRRFGFAFTEIPRQTPTGTRVIDIREQSFRKVFGAAGEGSRFEKDFPSLVDILRSEKTVAGSQKAAEAFLNVKNLVVPKVRTPTPEFPRALRPTQRDILFGGDKIILPFGNEGQAIVSGLNATQTSTILTRNSVLSFGKFASVVPSGSTSILPSTLKSILPSFLPSQVPSKISSKVASVVPSKIPSIMPSRLASSIPSRIPSIIPSRIPSQIPSQVPSRTTSTIASQIPSIMPSRLASRISSRVPSVIPSRLTSIIPQKRITGIVDPFVLKLPKPKKGIPIQNKVQGFDAFAKQDSTKTARFTKITTKPRPKSVATFLGLQAVDNSISQDAKIIQTNKKVPNEPTPFGLESLLGKFRQRIVKGKPTQEVYIEKRMFAIDTFGERQGLKAGRVAKQQAFKLQKASLFNQQKKPMAKNPFRNFGASLV